MTTPMIIPRTVNSARFCSFPFTRAEVSGKSPNRSRLRHLARGPERHCLDHATLFRSAPLEVTHISPRQPVAFNQIFHFVILRAFAAGETQFKIGRPLTSDADRLQKGICQIDERLFWKGNFSGRPFNDYSRKD